VTQPDQETHQTQVHTGESNVTNTLVSTLACVQELRLESFTITMLDDEPTTMAMLHALSRKHYGKFVSALMRQKDLKRADIMAAFQVEQVKRTAHHGPLIGSAALRTFGKPTSPRSNLNECPFCSIKGHAQDDCYKYKSARANYDTTPFMVHLLLPPHCPHLMKSGYLSDLGDQQK
jgi:hypothetical protein